ncbi:MAG: disulfide bond formation protein B [Rhodospirillales bacterium]|nr:disulfide bond formation protein B [Rhodospirillales bacterium]
MGETRGIGQRPVHAGVAVIAGRLAAAPDRRYIRRMLALSRTDPARLFLMLILATSLTALASAFAGQYVFGLEPCVLCLWQRVPFAAAAAIAALGLVGWGRRRAVLPIALAALVFAIGAAIAFFHVGVQQHWWSSVAGCGGVPVTGMSVEDLSPSALANPPKPCDVVDWRLLGLSLAGWNTVVSTALTAACVAAFTLLRKNQRT